jgi:hypothetical protein
MLMESVLIMTTSLVFNYRIRGRQCIFRAEFKGYFVENCGRSANSPTQWVKRADDMPDSGHQWPQFNVHMTTRDNEFTA